MLMPALLAFAFALLPAFDPWPVPGRKPPDPDPGPEPEPEPKPWPGPELVS